ncbi:MAG: hypothetical protein ACJ75R_04865 [Solirubrobacterales bacterium]
MKQVMVRYRVKPDRVAENEELVRAVYEELEREAPEGFQYATFRLDDGQTFVHVALGGTQAAPLPRLNAFKRFQERLADRVEEGPLVSQLDQIGSFRLVAGRGQS